MKTLGIIGGIGPESTIEYYRRIHASYRARVRDGSAPSILLNSIDMQKLVSWVEANELGEMAGYLIAEVEKLARGGAAFGLLAANTPHLVFDAVAQQSTISLLSIVQATCEAAKTRGLTRLGLLGTRFTMQASFYRDALSEEQIELVEALWDNIVERNAVPGPTEAQKAELDRRLSEHAAHPDDVVPWSEVKDSALTRIRR